MNATTTATTHTPGPWLAYNADKGRTLKHWRIRGHCVRNDPTFATIDSNGKLSPEYEAANARLIAAAPELLAALTDAAKWLDRAADLLSEVADGYGGEAEKFAEDAMAARAVIAKATA